MNKIIIVMITFFSTLFGCGNKKQMANDIYPNENFSVFEAILDDNPIIGSMNLAYKDYPKKDTYAWCLKIAIGLELGNCYENGLPKSKESQIAVKLEDELLKEIKDITTAHYIGHIYFNSFLDVYIYLDDPKEVHNYLQTQINKEDLSRGFGYEIFEDPTWKTVDNFLK
jgi:uncharacterized protein DUF695